MADEPVDVLILVERLESSEHTMTCERWAAFLLIALPAVYADLPPPQHPAACLPGSEAKIELLRRRAARDKHGRRTAASRGLWHEDDLAWEAVDGEGRQTARRLNGSTEQKDLASLNQEETKRAS